MLLVPSFDCFDIQNSVSVAGGYDCKHFGLSIWGFLFARMWESLSYADTDGSAFHPLARMVKMYVLPVSCCSQEDWFSVFHRGDLLNKVSFSSSSPLFLVWILHSPTSAPWDHLQINFTLKASPQGLFLREPKPGISCIPEKNFRIDPYIATLF